MKEEKIFKYGVIYEVEKGGKGSTILEHKGIYEPTIDFLLGKALHQAYIEEEEKISKTRIKVLSVDKMN